MGSEAPKIAASLQRSAVSRVRTRTSEFRPGPLLRSPMFQTALASAPLRRAWIRWRDSSIESRAEEVLLDCGDGVRLQGFHTAPPEGRSNGRLAVLFHGWEGSAGSTYLLSLATRLHRQGYAVFRLNFRDHGETHHLNQDIFHSCRIAEVVGAVAAIAERYPQRPRFLAGFSLGANFALRVALRAPARQVDLDHVVAVAPVLEPKHSMHAMDYGPRWLQRYFIRKWQRSLRKKQQLFPDLLDYEGWFRLDSLHQMTEWLIDRDPEFKDLDEYLSGYAISGNRLLGLAVPTSILTAADDPVIPVEDYDGLQLSPSTSLQIEQLGGHCGFIRNAQLHSWIDERIEAIFAAAA